uniref:Roadblock/LAMTOR2 domain-containing protein n=1 Tax=Archaeoglobus fulgidus TaxID=2234 RepID=A0A7C3RAP7_ARCFL
MLYEVIVIVLGGVLGFGVTWAYLSQAMRQEKAKEEEIRIAKVSTVTSSIEPKGEIKIDKPPSDLTEFVEYLSGKYMLTDVTLLTPEGLPIASNSSSPEEDAAIAPELIKIGKSMLNSSRIIISGENTRILVMQVSPDVLLHARVARDISRREIERVGEEIKIILEGML